MKRRRARLLMAAAGVTGLLAIPAAASAQPFTVTRFDDPPPDACAPGDCSLREAIRAANAAAGADSIALGPGTYALSQVGSDTAALAGDLDITDDLTLSGAGPAQTTIDGNGAATGDRVFHVDPQFGVSSPALGLADLTVTDGTGSFGAGLYAENEARTVINRVSISGNNGTSFSGGVFNENDAVMTIRDSEIRDNSISSGFAIAVGNQNNAQMTIERTTISGNTAPAASFGGAVFNQNEAVLTMRDSTVSDNTAAARGGGFFMQNNSVTTIENSTVSGNTSGLGSETANEVGGGFFIQNNARVTLRNVTVSGNRAEDAGGGFSLQDAPVVRLENSTVTANIANLDGADGETGGGIFADLMPGGSATLSSTILASNTAPAGPDCVGPVSSAGFNLVGDSSGCSFTAGLGDQVGTGGAPIAPELGLLQVNGGPTATHLPALGSPAVDAGTANGLATDQRGLARTSDFATVANRPGSDGTDVGSVELQAGDFEGTCRGRTVLKVDGTEAADTLVGTEASELISALDGNDLADGAGGDDCLDGGAGKDRLKGAAGNDRIDGGAGKDRLNGSAGKDRIDGGAGKDKVKGGSGKDKLRAADGKRDKVNCGGGRDKATVDKKDRVKRNCERVKVRD